MHSLPEGLPPMPYRISRRELVKAGLAGAFMLEASAGGLGQKKSRAASPDDEFVRVAPDHWSFQTATSARVFSRFFRESRSSGCAWRSASALRKPLSSPLCRATPTPRRSTCRRDRLRGGRLRGRPLVLQHARDGQSLGSRNAWAAGGVEVVERPSMRRVQ